MPSVACVLCSRRLKLHQRRPVNKVIAKYLRKNFLLENTSDKYICGRCSRPAYDGVYTDNRPSSQIPDPMPTDITGNTSNNTNTANLRSPPTIKLDLKATSKSHAYCCICKKPGPRLLVVPANARNEAFVKHNILITAGSRCCAGHLNDSNVFDDNVLRTVPSVTTAYVNRSTLLELLTIVRRYALTSAGNRMSFDDLQSLTDVDMDNMTGIKKDDFLFLLQIVKSAVRNTPVRSVATSLGIFLFKLRAGISNKVLSTLFGISKSSVRRAVHTIRKALTADFVPSNLGFQHISREEVIEKHTRELAKSLLSDSSDNAIIVLDGTYIYIQKSSNFAFQRRTYSLHKGRPLVKPMVIVSTSGYFISVIGPYLANIKNNDASILSHIMNNDIEAIKEWIHEDDIFVVDRGFRDSIGLLGDLGIQARMPAFMTRGQKQLTTEDANSSRIVTKVRWIVEAANARIKRWKYLDHILPTNQVPYIGDYVRIVCALSNRFLPELNATKDTIQDRLTASRMLDKLYQKNILQTFIEENGLHRRSVTKWSTVHEVHDFPTLEETMLQILTLGTYQLSLCPSYIQEYLGGDCTLDVYRENAEVLRVRLQSRHVSSRSNHVWIQYDSDCVKAWFCQCRSGARTVGMCSHVASVIWHLSGLSGDSGVCGVKDWGQYIDDASHVPQTVDSSDSDSNVSGIEE